MSTEHRPPSNWQRPRRAQPTEPAQRVLDPVKNDPAELERRLGKVERSLAFLKTAWARSRAEPRLWADRLASLIQRVRADVREIAERGLPDVAPDLRGIIDGPTRDLWSYGRLPAAEAMLIHLGHELCYYLHYECGWWLNDPDRIRRLADVAERALERTAGEPGARYVRAVPLHAWYRRVRDDADRIAAFGAPPWLEHPDSHFDYPALHVDVTNRYDSVAVLSSPELSAWLAALDLYGYVEGECGLHLNDPAHLLVLLSAAEEALELAPPADRVPFLVELYRSIRRNLPDAAENGMKIPGSLARGLDGFDDRVVSSAIALAWYLERCQRRGGGVSGG